MEWVETSEKVGLQVIVRPAVMYGVEILALAKRQEAKLKSLRFSLGDTGMDEIGRVHQRDSSGCAGWRHSKRGKDEVVWTCAEEG